LNRDPWALRQSFFASNLKPLTEHLLFWPLTLNPEPLEVYQGKSLFSRSLKQFGKFWWGMDSIFIKKILDRIYRIFRIRFIFPAPSLSGGSCGDHHHCAVLCRFAFPGYAGYRNNYDDPRQSVCLRYLLK
jgi:hypothetical protein